MLALPIPDRSFISDVRCRFSRIKAKTHLSGNLVVQLGVATEDLNRRWYQANAGQVLADVQRRIRHPVLRWMATTLDGRVEATGAVFEAKFMLPWSFSEEVAAEKYMPQLQHNMWVVAARSAVLSVITGGGKWVEITTHADPLYRHLIVIAERKLALRRSSMNSTPAISNPHRILKSCCVRANFERMMVTLAFINAT
jgi:predicted phage-related endonuclease